MVFAELEMVYATGHWRAFTRTGSVCMEYANPYRVGYARFTALEGRHAAIGIRG